MFDLDKSYYVLGTVDENTNKFTEIGTKINNLPKNLAINTDGTYHLHLVDVVGNTYDSYLELGQNNWKLQETFNDSVTSKDKGFKIVINDLSNGYKHFLDPITYTSPDSKTIWNNFK